MHFSAEHDAFAVIDDFLDEEAWSEVWTHFQFTELLPVSRTRGAWKLTDGVPLAGHDIHTPQRDEELGEPLPEQTPDAERTRFPTGTAFDHVFEQVLSVAGQLERWVGDDWQKISARPYVYPTNTGLGWHSDDHEFYQGAFIYYAHPEWDVHWGGELLLAEVAGPDQLPMMGFRFESRDYSRRLSDPGLGHFILPKPNRLVVVRDWPHRIVPVSPAAGDHVRASLAGFFIRKDPHA